MTTGFSENLWGNDGRFTTVKPQVETTFQNGQKIETQKLNGQVVSVSVWEDLNGDGEYSSSELTKVIRYEERFDNQLKKLEGYQTRTYIDTNHNGYDDYMIIKEYDKDGNLVRKTEEKTESIKKENEDKYMQSQVHNSKMETHLNGNYIF